MYLLDANILIYALKGVVEVRANLERHKRDALGVSAITLMELYYGAHKSRWVENNLAKVLAIEASFEVFALGPECVETFGLLKARLESDGARLDDLDLAIAATALAHNLVLVSNNIRHFGRIPGLRLDNWAQE
jgi:predicted nucleic acid-binding protein